MGLHAGGLAKRRQKGCIELGRVVKEEFETKEGEEKSGNEMKDGKPIESEEACVVNGICHLCQMSEVLHLGAQALPARWN